MELASQNSLREGDGDGDGDAVMSKWSAAEVCGSRNFWTAEE